MNPLLGGIRLIAYGDIPIGRLKWQGNLWEKAPAGLIYRVVTGESLRAVQGEEESGAVEK